MKDIECRKIVTDTVEFCEDQFPSDYYAFINWLKSLPEKYNGIRYSVGVWGDGGRGGYFTFSFDRFETDKERCYRDEIEAINKEKLDYLGSKEWRHDEAGRLLVIAEFQERIKAVEEKYK